MELPELTALDWNLLRAFACVVEQGSLTKAAQQLGLSQPTLSRQIAALELQLGAPLFERTGRRLRPTDLAQALQEPAQRMHAAVQALGPLTQMCSTQLGGTVRISANEVVASCVLPPILLQLAQQHPEIEVELVANSQTDHLLDRQCDIAVRLSRPAHSTVARYMGEWASGLYVHRRYLERVGGQIDPTQLGIYRWIGLDQNPFLLDSLRAAGHDIDRHFFDLRSDNLIVGLEAVRAGLGIGMLNRPVASRYPELMQVLPDQPLPSMPVWLVAHRELRGDSRLRVVFDLVAEALSAFSHPAMPAQVTTGTDVNLPVLRGSSVHLLQGHRPPLTSSSAPVL